MYIVICAFFITLDTITAERESIKEASIRLLSILGIDTMGEEDSACADARLGVDERHLVDEARGKTSLKGREQRGDRPRDRTGRLGIE